MTRTRPSRIDPKWAAAVGGIALLASSLGVAAWVFAPRDGVDPLSGPRMAIALVAPREPDIQPGSVLEVGDLSDGFDRAVLERASASIDDPTFLPPEAYVGPALELPRMPLPTPVALDREGAAPKPEQPASAPDPLRDGSRLFGFDRPGPDLSADRERRLAVLAEAERAAALHKPSSLSEDTSAPQSTTD